MMHPGRILRLTYVIAALVVAAGGGIWTWRALDPPDGTLASGHTGWRYR
jgi:hypothetical protein